MSSIIEEIDKEIRWLNQVETKARKNLLTLRPPRCMKDLVKVATAVDRAEDEETAAAVVLRASEASIDEAYAPGTKNASGAAHSSRVSVSPRIRVSVSHGIPQLYLVVSPQSRFGVYIPKKMWPMAAYLTQKKYYCQIIKLTEEKIHNLETMKRRIELQLPGEDSLARCVRQKFHVALLQFIKPMLLSDEEYVAKWSSEKYQGLSWKDEDKVFVTDRGEKVRSKSEKIIADKLFHLGIPYRYEAPLYLPKSDRIVYPDFTLLRVSDRQEIYLEHFGKLGEPGYADYMVGKYNDYIMNGIFWGKKGLYTFESAGVPFQIQQLNLQLESMNLTAKAVIRPSLPDTEV